jgi:hypothetical protein
MFSQARARLGKSGDGAPAGGKTLDDVLREAAGDAGLAMAFGGDFTLSDLMSQLTSAAAAPLP